MRLHRWHARHLIYRLPSLFLKPKNLLRYQHIAVMGERDPSEIKALLEKTCQYSFGFWDFPSVVEKWMDKLFTSAIQDYLKDGATFLQYGFNIGQPEYLEAVADFLTEMYQDKVESKSLVATYGASFGLMLMITHFMEKNDFMFFEDLSFGRAFNAASEFGLQVRSVSCDDEGISVTELEKQFKECKAKSTHEVTKKKPYWAMMYLMTVCHNPKGTSYTAERCRAIVKLARKYNVLVVVDDVYNVFQFEGAKSKRLVSFDDPNDEDYGIGHVVSNGTFSKILFPSLRLGWYETSPWIISQIDNRPDILGGGGYNAMNQGISVKIMKRPEFVACFKEINEHYTNVLYMTCDYLKKNLPEGFEFDRPCGGFFIWVRMPEKYDVTVLSKNLEKYGIVIGDGPKYSVENKYDNCFRLCVSNFPKEELMLSLEILCKEIKLLCA